MNYNVNNTNEHYYPQMDVPLKMNSDHFTHNYNMIRNNGGYINNPNVNANTSNQSMNPQGYPMEDGFSYGREFKSKIQKTSLQTYMNMEIDELAKHSYNLAKDQAGCRYLQKKIEEEPEIANVLIYPRIIEHLLELVNDAFGNYLIQKMLEYLADEKLFQLMAIVLLYLSNNFYLDQSSFIPNRN
jgi:hypothetical protein